MDKTEILISAVDQTKAAFESVSRGLGGIEGALGGINGMAAKIPLLGTALTAAFGTVNFTAFIQDTINAGDAMNDMSQRTGIAVADLAKYKLASDQSGASLAAVSIGVKGLSAAMAQHGDAFKKIGIETKDADKAFQQLADVFAAMPDGMEKASLAVKLFGRSGMELIPMLNMGGKGLQEAAEKAKEYATKMAEIAPQADAFNDLMAEFGMNAKASGMNITTYLLHGLTGMAGFMNDIARGGQDARKALEWLGESSPLMKGLLAAHDFMNRAGALSGASRGGSRVSTGKIGKQPETVDWSAWDAATEDYEARRAAKKKADALAAVFSDGKAGGAEKSAYDAIKKSLIEKTAAMEADAAVMDKLLPAEMEYAKFLAMVASGVT